MSAKDLSDEDLMRAYVAGDHDAFQTLFDRYAPIVFGMTRRHLRDEDLAREITQQTFFRLHAARNDFRLDSRLRPWLLTIAMNLVREHWRRGKRRKMVELDPETKAAPQAERSRMELDERSQLLHAALAKLPASQREVVELHWFQERPYKEGRGDRGQQRRRRARPGASGLPQARGAPEGRGRKRMNAATDRAEHDVDPALATELEKLLGPRGSGVRHRTVRSPEVLGDPEPELAQTPASSGEYATLFASLREEINAAEARPAFKLETQPTIQRRLLAGMVFAALLATSAGLMPRPDLATYSLPLLTATLLSLGVLFALVLVAAVRPAYLPSLPAGRERSLTLLGVAATCMLAVVPALAGEGHHHAEPGVLFHALPCLIFGLLGAAPVYAGVRVVDRDGGHLLPAVAAGLAASAILEVHCPYAGIAHRGLGHAAVLGVLLALVFAYERFRGRRA